MNEIVEEEKQDSFQEFASQALRLQRKGSFEQLLAQHLIQSVRNFGKALSDYLPREYDHAVVHFDPDFEHFTYGDSVETSKGKQISHLREGDYIFFVASLAPYVKKAYEDRDGDLIRCYQKGNMAKYVIGLFKVQAAYVADKAPDDSTPLLYEPFGSSERINYKIDADTLNRIRSNAHSRRDEDHYFVVVGHPSDSALLTHAIKLTENGSPFKPSDMGKKLYGNVCYPRGVKWIYEPSRIQALLNSCHLCI